MCDWAGRCGRLVVNSPRGLERAVVLLDLDPERFELIPNGFAPAFHPKPVDRPAHWRRHLADAPKGWRPGGSPGTVRYGAGELGALDGTVLLYSGRFTEVKRLTVLIEAFAQARERFASPAALVVLGGYPGEWEGEHPLETIERIGVPNVFLAGWHSHRDLPQFLNAADLLVHASVREQFGLVLVEAMACGVPPIAVNRGGPATIVENGDTGWLIPPDDRTAMADAMVEAVNDPAMRAERGRRGRRAVNQRYTWKQVGLQLADLVGELATARSASGAHLHRGGGDVPRAEDPGQPVGYL
jgi:glycosyltransferase involved in cell wall biosynthesis